MQARACVSTWVGQLGLGVFLAGLRRISGTEFLTILARYTALSNVYRTSDLHWLLVDAISPLIIRRFQDPSGYVLLPSPDYVPDPVGRGLVGSAPILSD